MTRLPTLLLSCALACLAMVAVPARALTPAQPPVEGRDYALIADGQPLAPKTGTIEVVEVFAYWCGHCARFAPQLEAWKRTQRPDVRLAYSPLPRSPNDALSRGFFATRASGSLARVHGALFVAIHETQAVPMKPTIDELAAWYGQQGLDAARLKAAMEAPALADQLAAARQFALRSGVEGTPTLVIDGRYRILVPNASELDT